MIRLCSYSKCGCTFECVRENHIFCSRRCYINNRYWALKQPSPPASPQICKSPKCGKLFTPASSNRVQKYCSAKCTSLAEYYRNRKSHLAQKVEYHKKNKETIRARSKTYRECNREIINQKCNNWHKNNPEKSRQRGIRRYRVQKDSLINFTENEWQSLIKAYKGRCAYCKKKCSELTQDHVVPVIKGGDHTIDNIVPACKSCNCAKGSMDVDDFIPYLLELG